MVSRFRRSAQQVSWLMEDVSRMTGGKWWRWGGVWFSERFMTIARYRLDRGAHLAFGRGWDVTRTLLSPVRFAVRPWTGRCDVSHHADIGPGLQILHGSLGVVISGNAVIGKNLVLVGGNCIGARKAGEIRIGDDVLLGANSSVIGPLTVGDRVRIGANALVTHDVGPGETLFAPVARPRTS